MNVISRSKTFSILRIALGLWLFIHFVFIFPEVKELYSLEGIKVAGGELYLAAFLKTVRSTLGIQLLCSMAIIASLGLIFKFKRRFCSLLLFIVWIFFFHQNILTYTPLHPFMGWILLAISTVEENEVRFPWNKETKEFQYSAILFSGFWIICACAYSSSGIQKFLFSPLWAKGMALDLILQYPSNRFEVIFQLFNKFPDILKIAFNYYVLVFEGLFFISLFHEKLRKIFWFGILGMHLAIWLTLEFTELTFGMLIIHFFLIEESWFNNFGLGSFKWKLKNT